MLRIAGTLKAEAFTRNRGLCKQIVLKAMISADKIQENLRTQFIGRKLHAYDTVSSTNDVAKALALEGAEEGTVIIAETQTRGRGRMRREWFSPEGGLWFSVILKPKTKAKEVTKITLAVGVAIAKALKRQFNLNAEVKWPNDVLANGRKVCGILTESVTYGEAVKIVVVGVGLNADISLENFSRSIRDPLTTLKEELKTEVSLEPLLCEIFYHIEREYAVFLKQGFARILGEWKALASFIGKDVEVTVFDGKFRGLAEDVDADGSLIVRLSDGSVKRVETGDVKVRMV
jgi:BirA family biotin operon repressor/biotin-[acetyl-CoA-carboxylase] ligase